jgi:hypothetical protein
LPPLAANFQPLKTNKMNAPTFTEILRVQKKQFEMGLYWIGLLQDNRTSAQDKALALEQYALLHASIFDLQCAVAQTDILC